MRYIKTTQRKYTLDKDILKSVLASLKPEQKISINFVKEYAKYNSDTYKVIKVSRGKGKGGSLIMTVMNETNGELLESIPVLVKGETKTCMLGTPVSDQILNITANGIVHGVKNESELPKSYARSKEDGANLKKHLLPLLTKKTPTKIRIESNLAPEFNGTWFVENAKLNPGCGGQISLALVDLTDPTRKITLFSYRHGSVIEMLEVLDENT